MGSSIGFGRRIGPTRRHLIASLTLPFLVLALATDAAAEDGVSVSRASAPTSTTLRAASLAPELSQGLGVPARGPRTRERQRDSLKNGAVIGALAGAAALGTFAGVLCKAMQEPGGPSCAADTVRIAAIGAAIGLGAGLAIDASMSRQSGARVSVAVRF